jgi:hypothetical protein
MVEESSLFDVSGDIRPQMIHVYITWTDAKGRQHITRVQWAAETVAAMDYDFAWPLDLARRELMGDAEVWKAGGARDVVSVSFSQGRIR